MTIFRQDVMQGVDCTALHCTALHGSAVKSLHWLHRCSISLTQFETSGTIMNKIWDYVLPWARTSTSLHKNPLIWPTVHRGKREKCEVVRVEWVVGNESFMCWDGPTLSGGRTRHWVPGLSCPPPLEVSHSQDRRRQLMKVQLSTTIPIQVNCKIIQIFEFPFVL